MLKRRLWRRIPTSWPQDVTRFS